MKKEAAARFKLTISCLLDIRFNQLSHTADEKPWIIDKIANNRWTHSSFFFKQTNNFPKLTALSKMNGN